MYLVLNEWDCMCYKDSPLNKAYWLGREQVYTQRVWVTIATCVSYPGELSQEVFRG